MLALHHTPTPWRVDSNAQRLEIENADAIPVCRFWGLTEKSTANARFIVRAVNCHQELLAALEYLQAATACYAGTDGNITQALADARAAIEKATVQSC